MIIAGRVMYVIPFSMGPIGGPMSKFGIQLTDYNYVVLSMRIMTRVDPVIWKKISKDSDFVQCIHTIGVPRPLPSKFTYFYFTNSFFIDYKVSSFINHK